MNWIDELERDTGIRIVRTTRTESGFEVQADLSELSERVRAFADAVQTAYDALPAEVRRLRFTLTFGEDP